MAVVVTPEQRASTDPVMKEWVASKDKENAPAPTAVLGAVTKPGYVSPPQSGTPYTGTQPTNADLSQIKGNAAAVAENSPTAPVPQAAAPSTGVLPAAPAAPNLGYDLAGITKTATDSVNGQIAAQIAAYNQQVASGQQANNLALSQNNNYLTSALKSSGDQHTVDSSNAQTTQNRRGGFYSGGLDFQLGSQDRAYATAEGNLKQDVQSRNDDIYAKNALLATQAASNIQMLQDQAPAQIAKAIQDEIDRQRGINIQEAGITGQYNGADTMAQAQNNISNNIAEAGLTGEYTPQKTTALQLEMASNSASYAGASVADQVKLHQRNEEIGNELGMTYNSQTGKWTGGDGSVQTIAGQNNDRETVKLQDDQAKQLADLTGYMSDGKGGYMPTNAKQQQDLTNAWKVAEEMGVVSPALSQLTGIKVGTPTQTAKNQAVQNGISQQNANTSTANGVASRANMAADNTRQDNALADSKKNKEFEGEVAGELALATSKEDVTNFFNTNAAEIAKKLGIDAATKMKNDALAPYLKPAPVPIVDPAVKYAQDVHEKAIAAAQKDPSWSSADTAKKAALIKDYEALFK